MLYVCVPFPFCVFYLLGYRFLISSFSSRCALSAKRPQRVVLYQTLFRGWAALGRCDIPLQRGLHCVSIDVDALPLVSPMMFHTSVI